MASRFNEIVGGERPRNSRMGELLGNAKPRNSRMQELLGTAPAADTSWWEEIAGLAGGVGLGGLTTALLAPPATALTGPAGPFIAAGLGSLVGGLSQEGIEAGLESRDMDYSLGNAALDVGLGVGTFGLGRMASRALAKSHPLAGKSAGFLDTLTGSGQQPQTRAMDVGVWPKEEGLGLLGKVRQTFSSAIAMGRNSKNASARKLAGELQTFGETERAILSQGDDLIGRVQKLVEPGSASAERVAQARWGLVPRNVLSPEEQQALDLADEFFDGFDRLFHRVGHTTRRGAKDMPYESITRTAAGGKYVPTVAKDDIATQTLREVADPGFGGARQMSMHSKLKDMPIDEREWDISKLMQGYLSKQAPRAAATRAFGPKLLGQLDGEFTDYGARANNLLRDMAEKATTQREKLEVLAFRDALNEVYKFGGAPGAGDELIERVRRGMSTSVLGLSPWRQVGQIGTTAGQYGVGPSARGAFDALTNPAVRRAALESGAATSPLADFSMKGAGKPGGLLWRMLSTAERVNRTHAAAAGMRVAETIARKAGRYATVGEMPAALRRKFVELGIDAGKYARGGSRTLSLEDLHRAAQKVADTTQFQPFSFGESGTEMLTNPAWRMLSQFKPFTAAATRRFHENTLRPLMGRTTPELGASDLSLNALGLARALRGPALTLGATALGTGLSAGAALRAPDPTQLMSYALGTEYGIPGEMLGEMMRSGPTGAVTGTFFSPPAIEVGKRTAADATSGDPRRMAKAAIQGAATYPSVAPFAPAARSLLEMLSR